MVADAAERWVSAASGDEIALKTRLGKLAGGAQILDGWRRVLRNARASELPLSVRT